MKPYYYTLTLWINRHTSIPFMLTDLIDFIPLFRLCIQDPDDKILRLRSYIIRNFILSSQNFHIKLLRILIFKRKVPSKQRKQNHPTGSKVNSDPNIRITCYHLRSCVTRRSTRCFQVIPLLIKVA